MPMEADGLSGFIFFKRTGKYKVEKKAHRWKKQFLVVNDKEKSLLLFKNKLEAATNVFLDDVPFNTIVNVILHPMTKKEGTRFDIKTKEDTLAFGTASRDEAVQWTTLIRSRTTNKGGAGASETRAADSTSAADAIAANSATLVSLAEDIDGALGSTDSPRPSSNVSTPRSSPPPGGDAAARDGDKQQPAASLRDQRLTQVADRMLDTVLLLCKAEALEPTHSPQLRKLGKDLILAGLKMAVNMESLADHRHETAKLNAPVTAAALGAKWRAKTQLHAQQK